MPEPSTTETSEQLFYLTGPDAQAEGKLITDGFLVRSGSLARKDVVPSAIGLPGIRERLLSEGVLEEREGRLYFTKDHVFGSPSGAAGAVLGRRANGWQDWKDANGRSLSEVKRVVRPNTPMLDDRTRSAIRDKFAALRESGTIDTDAQRERAYTTFRERFGPAILAKLDGEELLEYLHNDGDESLVYWLEYKSDEVFATKRFGNIAGGSALKYRVFRRKETGNWQARGVANKPCDIPLEEAIEFARTHRDQLVRGCELVEGLPEHAVDEDYASLQDQMDELAPDVGKFAWAHKYFSLVFPHKIDEFHMPAWQRFHIRKLLQLPPDRDGNYICTGRFVAAAREVELPLYHFTSTLSALQGRLHRYWRIGTSSGRKNVNYWSMMRDRGCVAVGWAELGDLSWVDGTPDTRDKLKAHIHDKYPTTPSAEGRASSEITRFIATIAEGDIVWAADGARLLGIGRVTGGYRYVPGHEFPHRRSVEWLDVEEWKMPIHEGLQSTVREIRLHDENIVETERRIRNAARKVDPIKLGGVSGRIQSVLERKGQVILYGPPGTGKTFWAERTAKDLAALSRFQKRFEQLEPAQQNLLLGDGEAGGSVRFCCFHPAYGYEDFLEGYRPQTLDGQVVFELRPGIFKQLCIDAQKEPEQSFYLIVDEINRGDIPRVFGELLTVLELDKRTKRLTLPVSQDRFSVPANVFLIGTMNTADRSISLLDAALRRRFGFVEMMPDGEVLGSSQVHGIPLRAWFEALNERIREHVGRDSRNLQIGHSYLMSNGSPLKDIASLKRALRDDILPLLEEYCYEDYGTLERILGNGLIDAKAQRVNHGHFDEGQEEFLVDALLAPFPEIARTTAAIASDEASLISDTESEESEGDGS